jgi:hypothetical protein
VHARVTRSRVTARSITGIVVAAAVAYFVTLASLWPSRPGLSMEETNFVNAALFRHFPHQEFVYRRVAGIPVLILPYIGTLKSALFAPVFDLAGVSVPTVRLPVIALSAMTLVVAYLMAREFLGRWSTVLVMLMATCPTFVFMSKVDWSPMVVAMLLRMGLLLTFFRYLNSRRIGWLWALFGLALLGIFNKQDFLWFAMGVAVAAAVVYRRPLWKAARYRLGATVVAVATFVAAGIALGLGLVIPNLSAGGSFSVQDPLPHLASVWALYERTVGYSEVVGFFTGRTIVQPVWMDWLWLPALAALVLLAIRRLKGSLPEQAEAPARAAVFFVIVAAVMFVEIAATKKATGPQHVIELVPYQDLIVLCSLFGVLRAGASLRVPIVVVAGMALLGTLAVQAVSTTQYISLMQNPARLPSVFSTDVYRNAAFLAANAARVDEVVSGGWGQRTPLFSLACPADRSKHRDDLWPRLVDLTPQSAPSVVRAAFGNSRILFVSVSNPSRSGLPQTLRSDPSLIARAYSQAFPGRHSHLVLSTNAYDVTYFGPSTFRQGHGGC